MILVEFSLYSVQIHAQVRVLKKHCQSKPNGNVLKFRKGGIR